MTRHDPAAWAGPAGVETPDHHTPPGYPDATVDAGIAGHADDIAGRLGLDLAADVARELIARAEAVVDPRLPSDRGAEAAVLGAAVVSRRCLDAAQAVGWGPQVCAWPTIARLSRGLLDHLDEVGGLVDGRTAWRLEEHLRRRHVWLPGDRDVLVDAMCSAVTSPPSVEVDARHLVDLAGRRDRLLALEAETAELLGVVA